MKLHFLTLIAILSISFNSVGQISLLKDINTFPAGSIPKSNASRVFSSINDKTIIVTQNEILEYDIVSVDSSNHNVSTLLKLVPGNEDNISFTLYNRYLYFLAYTNGGSSRELWKTNGTIEGTFKIKDGILFSSEIIVHNGLMYFLTYDSIWKSDGTTEGTSKILAISYSVINKGSKNLIGFQNNIIFRVNYPEYSFEKLDLQTLTIATIAQTSYNAGTTPEITSFIDTNDALYFIDKRNENSFLWKITRTDFQISLVDTYNDYVQELNQINNHIIFSTKHSLVSIDVNSNSNPVVLQDTLSTLPYYLHYSPYSATLNNQFYIIAAGIHSGYKLWKSDGTVNGTVAIKELPFEPIGIFTLDNFLYFKLKGQNKLWKSDGTTLNTSISFDLPNIEIDSLTNFERQFWVCNHKAFFWGKSSQYGAEPYFTDGNTLTDLVKDINTGTRSAFPDPNSVKIDGVFYFVAYTDNYGYELWKSDGTPENTVMVKDIAQGIASSVITNMTEMNGILYFSANDVIHGSHLWRSDGTPEGTYMVKLIGNTSSNSGSFPNSLTVFNGYLYFSAKDGTSNSDLWKSDGTESGTIKFRQSLNYSSVSNIYTTNKKLYFVASGNRYDQVLWVSDGNNDTHSLKDLPNNVQGLNVFYPTCFATMDNKVYFFGQYTLNNSDALTHEALFVTDGTENGTQIVRDFGIFTGGPDSLALSATNNLFLTSANNRLFFRVKSLKSGSTYSYEHYLWTSDGTASGTKLISSDTKNMLGYYNVVNTSSNIYYIFNPGYDNQIAELWTTDGNTNTKLKTFPFLFRNNYNFTLFNDSLYLNYSPLGDLKYDILRIGGLTVENYLSSNRPIVNLFEMDGNLYFKSYESNTGYELWKLQTCNYATTKQSGEWNNPETWLCNRIPNTNDTVLIQPSHTIEINEGTKRLKKLILRGKIDLKANTTISH